jgi:hypothetical protein
MIGPQGGPWPKLPPPRVHAYGSYRVENEAIKNQSIAFLYNFDINII